MIYSAKRRARKMHAGGSFTAGEFKELCDRYGNRCLACGRANVKLEADHVVPVKLGGTSDISNIQPLCTTCNRKKYTQVIDYRQKGARSK
jgi:5-methylcytosine-specific restriction endonuclease McrA